MSDIEVKDDAAQHRFELLVDGEVAGKAVYQARAGAIIVTHSEVDPRFRGQGLANVLAALEQGVDSFESSFGELGGCPVPPGATGNVASEDLVSMLHEMGIETGIDLPALVEASREAQQALGRPLGSHVLIAGPVDWHRGQAE